MDQEKQKEERRLKFLKEHPDHFSISPANLKKREEVLKRKEQRKKHIEEVLKLKYEHGLTTHQIALKFGVSQGRVITITSTYGKKLREERERKYREMRGLLRKTSERV